MTGHAILSPSGAHRWMRCVGAPAMEMGSARSSSAYADEGTAAHFVASQCLTHKTNASIMAGMNIEIDAEGECKVYNPQATAAGSKLIHVNPDMVTYVQQYLDFVREQAVGGELLIEAKLPIGHITLEEDAEGSGDAVILAAPVLKVVDLKYGRGQIVSAVDNEQMKMYALGAIEQQSMLYDFETVEMYIHQPRAQSEPSVAVVSVEDLFAWSIHAAQQAAEATKWMAYMSESGSIPLDALTPGEKQCQWCKAKATCPKLASWIEETVGAGFDDIQAIPEKAIKQAVKEEVDEIPDEILGQKLDAVELIEQWCKAVRAEVERKLLAGEPVTGYKLVQGKKGNRAWVDEAQVEELFKSMRLKAEEKYTMKLISPTQAEALLKDTPKRWERVVEAKLITQAPGQPSVAPVSDKREEYNPAAKADDFDMVGEFDVGDLI